MHSAFSGWTQANNAMFALQYIHDNGENIKDPEIRNLYCFFKKYVDTTKFRANPASSDWMWETRSPMDVLRQKMVDSLRLDYYKSIYALAPSYSKLGAYIEFHHPYAFFNGFIVPNFETLITPHDGEMMDYYVGPKTDQVVLDRYHITQSMIFCRKQIYKDTLNKFDLFFYRMRMILFILSIVFVIKYRRKLNSDRRLFLTASSIFVILFYLLMLYSSRFMPRYTMPILPLMTMFIFISIMNLIKFNLNTRNKLVPE